VDFKGNLYTCPWFVGNPSLCIGNVFREPMYDAGKVLDVGRKQVVSEESAGRGCGYRRACGGGCSVTRVLAGQTTAGADGTLAERARLFQCAQVKPAVQQLIFEDFERAVGGRVRTRHTHESVAGSPR
jgi:radical SAM protein with 4Fe4S-binding SPASM domain